MPALLTLWALASSTVLSAQPDGDPPESLLSGTLNDEPVNWVLLNQPPRSSAVFTTLLPGVHNVRITGYASERGAREGSITVEFTLRDGEVQNPKLLYFPFAPLHPRFSYASDHNEIGNVMEAIERAIESLHSDLDALTGLQGNSGLLMLSVLAWSLLILLWFGLRVQVQRKADRPSRSRRA